MLADRFRKGAPAGDDDQGPPPAQATDFPTQGLEPASLAQAPPDLQDRETDRFTAHARWMGRWGDGVTG